jgi:hypothetical protein
LQNAPSGILQLAQESNPLERVLAEINRVIAEAPDARAKGNRHCTVNLWLLTLSPRRQTEISWLKEEWL